MKPFTKLLKNTLPAIAMAALSMTAHATGVMSVSINDYRWLDAANPYLVNGYPAASGTLGSDGCTAQFDDATGTLTLQDYHGDYIFTNDEGDLTVVLIGNNSIVTTIAWFGIGHHASGSITITSAADASLTIDVNHNNAYIYAIGSYNGNVNTYGDITISGKAEVTAEVMNTISVGTAYGLCGKNINILDDASFAVNAKTAAMGTSYVMGISSCKTDAGDYGNIAINTSGTVTLNVSLNAGNNYAFWGNMTLTKIAVLTLKWKGFPTPYNIDYCTFTYDAAKFSVNRSTPYVEIYTYTIGDEPDEYAIHVETDGNGTAFASANAAAAGTEIMLTATPGDGYVFDRWTTVPDNLSITDNTFIMPAQDVTVLAVFRQVTDGIGQWTMENGQWTVYPNPTNGMLHIVSAGAGATHALPVQVYNIAGQSVWAESACPNTTDGAMTIDISHLAKGMYFLKAGGKMVKIIKE